MTTRRDFIRQAALLGAGLSMNPFFIKASSNSVGANDKIRVGLIGCKGMGYSDLQAFLRNPEVECIALADIDENVLNNRAAETEKLTGKKVKHLYKDWRKLIDNKDVDVVIIGTPDHWHCLQMVAACEAGKDVYCEKPLGNSIEECNIMVPEWKDTIPDKRIHVQYVSFPTARYVRKPLRPASEGRCVAIVRPVRHGCISRQHVP